MKNINIVIADDQINVLSNLLEELKKNSNFHIVGVAYNGLELLNLLRTNSVDCLITDNQMPGMTGLEVIKKIKEESEVLPHIFVVSADNIFIECQKLNIRLLTKPISASKIVEIISREIESLENFSEKEYHKENNTMMEISTKKENIFKKILKK